MLGDKQPDQIIRLASTALEANPQVNSRYRGDLNTLVLEIMGREFFTEARQEGLLDSPAAPEPGPEGEPDSPAVVEEDSTGHDFFDV